MFTEPGLNINVTARPFLSSGCQLRVLAIGGGGEGYGDGGGSGYIQFHSEMLNPETLISLTVGDKSQSSNVTVNGQTVMAAPGNDVVYGYGGSDGYSGGGGYGTEGCEGGTDGSDGEDGYYGDGGHGNGEDVTAYKMDNFVLTPGAGDPYSDGVIGHYVLNILPCLGSKKKISSAQPKTP